MSRNVIDTNCGAKSRGCGSNSSASLDCEPNTERHTSPNIDGIGVLSVASDPGGTFGSATTAMVDGQDNLAGAGDTGRQKRAIVTSANPTSVVAITRAQGSPDPKRRKTSRGFTAINSGVSDPANPCQGSTKALMPSRSSVSPQVCLSVDPLPGSRPTRILVGYWKGSDEPEPRDRHAVYGVLQHNDVFRMKVAKETRDGRFVMGNFPIGNGAIWMLQEDVEMEEHLRGLGQPVIKEYCRVRQYQLENGETSENRAEHEAEAIIAAQARIKRAAKIASNSVQPNPNSTVRVGAGAGALACPAATAKRRDPFVKPVLQPDESSLQHSLNKNGFQPIQQHSQACSNKVANKKISDDRLAGTEATQARTDCPATTREQAAAAAASATDAAYASAIAAAAAKSSPAPPDKGCELDHTNGVKRRRIPLEPRDAAHVQAAAEDVKFYDGVEYQRKTTGPLSGKLVSSGSIIIINGEEYVEYRVLARPSFG